MVRPVPRITVIIPTYHWSSVLPYAISSVLRQTFADFELLVIGDGCTDDTAEVVARFTDPRIRWFNLPVNTGHQSGPNNEGLRQAKGELIAYLGQDDLWLPHHLKLSVTAIDAGAGLTYALTQMVAPGIAVQPFEPAEMEHLLPGQWIPPTAVVHHRAASEKVGGWRRFIDINIDPEADLWQRIQNAGFSWRFIRRLTSVKFPAIWRKNAYQLKRSEEQATCWQRIISEPDFEATELSRMLLPVFADARAARPFEAVFKEFREDITARMRRKLQRLKLTRAVDRQLFLNQRRKFKGVK